MFKGLKAHSGPFGHWWSSYFINEYLCYLFLTSTCTCDKQGSIIYFKYNNYIVF